LETVAPCCKDQGVETGTVIADVQRNPSPLTAATTPAMIAVRDLTKKIGRQEILRGIDLTVAKGETLVIIGRSGGGKSVLLKHLIGLLQPDGGEIWIDGQNIIGLSERKLAAIRRKVGILFQGGALFDSMTVEENIAFPLREAGERDPKVIREKVSEMLEVMEMEGQQRKMPVNLSGGMKKRVGLARSIIRRPSCILYDEPTSGLDPVVSDSINRLIRRLQERFHVTSIVVTHDMKSAFHLADHIAYLHEGRIYFYGTPEELQASGDPLLQDFLLGRSEAQICIDNIESA
jgi:phospholipid/cholesterol/gamma-HCH transport system ATP-binding protein